MDRWKLIFYTCVFREFFKMSQSAKTVASFVNRYSVCKLQTVSLHLWFSLLWYH